MSTWKARLAAAIVCSLIIGKTHAGVALDVKEGDFVVTDFHFWSGQTLPTLRLHYRTLGQPVQDAHGRISNAALMLHATAGDGQQFLQPQFADALLARAVRSTLANILSLFQTTSATENRRNQARVYTRCSYNTIMMTWLPPNMRW
jgi:hypothetical protein